MRSFPGQEKRPLRRKGPMRVGTASIIPSGSACSRPRRSTKMVRIAGLVGISRSARPRARHRARPSGFWARIASGPASTTNPPVVSVWMTPP